MTDIFEVARQLGEMDTALKAGREELSQLQAQRAESEAILRDQVTEIEAQRTMLAELQDELARRKGEVMAGDERHRPGQIEQWDTFEALERLERVARGQAAALEKPSQQGNEIAVVMTRWLTEHADAVFQIRQRWRPVAQPVRILR